MNETYYRILSIRNKMDENSKIQSIMKFAAGITVFVMFFCCMYEPQDNKIAWIISVPAICILFGIDVFYIKKNKEYEFLIYQLEVDELREKKELAEILNEPLSDYVLNRKIEVPSKELKLPLVFYIIMLVLDIFVRIFMIH